MSNSSGMDKAKGVFRGEVRTGSKRLSPVNLRENDGMWEPELKFKNRRFAGANYLLINIK